MSDHIERILEQAYTSAATIERPAARCQALTGIAETWLLTGNKVRGFEIISEALKAADLLKHPDEKAKQLAWLSRLLKEAGQEVQAGEQFKRAYYLARAAESVPQKINALYCLASEYLDAGLTEAAKLILSELEPLVLDPASGVDTVCELINIAEIQADMHDVANSAVSLTKAVQAARSLKDFWFKAERLIEIAEIYNDIELRSEAAGLIQEACSEVERIDETSRPYFWMKLAAAYVEMDLKTQAADCLLKARDAILNSDDLNMAANDVLELAESYINLDKRSVALELLEKNQTIIGDLPEVQYRILRLLESADLYRRLEENPKTLRITEIVYQLGMTVVDSKAKLFTLGKLAILHVSLNNIEKARELVNEMSGIVTAGKTKTSGLGAIAEEMLAGGEASLAFKLAEVIREPEVKTSVFIAAAKNVMENQVR